MHERLIATIKIEQIAGGGHNLILYEIPTTIRERTYRIRTSPDSGIIELSDRINAAITKTTQLQ